jgi:hypothetical protein
MCFRRPRRWRYTGLLDRGRECVGGRSVSHARCGRSIRGIGGHRRSHSRARAVGRLRCRIVRVRSGCARVAGLRHTGGGIAIVQCTRRIGGRARLMGGRGMAAYAPAADLGRLRRRPGRGVARRIRVGFGGRRRIAAIRSCSDAGIRCRSCSRRRSRLHGASGSLRRRGRRDGRRWSLRRVPGRGRSVSVCATGVEPIRERGVFGALRRGRGLRPLRGRDGKRGGGADVGR